MTIYAISADTSTTIDASAGAEDTWVVKINVEVTTTNRAISAFGQGGDNTFLIYGNLIAETDGMYLGFSVNHNGGDNRVFISSTGSIYGQNHAVESYGGGLDLTNDGNLLSTDSTIDATDGSSAITNTGTITSSNHFGIFVKDGDNTISNDGTIRAHNNGIQAPGGSSEVTNTGTITSAVGSGISVTAGDNTVTNAGAIASKNYGIYAFGGSSQVINTGTIASSNTNGISANGGNNTISNDGDIGAATDGIVVAGADNLVINSGSVVTSTMSGSYAAVEITSGGGAANRLVNTGELSAQLNAVLGGAGDETIINRGTINGDVSLGAGSDTYDGRHGHLNSAVLGGAGDDIYIVDDPDITLIENTGEGTDLVEAVSGFALGDNFENLTLIGAHDHRGIGNGLDNAINGNIGDNVLRGRGGSDRLFGGEGEDTLHGGTSADSLYGDDGNDLLVGGPGNDALTGGAGADSLDGGAGSDTANYYESSAAVIVNLNTGSASGGDAAGDMLTNIENLGGSLFDDMLTGAGGANILTGYGGNDTLNGNGGNDTLQGGPGNDVLYGGAGSDSIDGGADSDTASYSTSAAAVIVNLNTDNTSGGDAEGDVLTGIENLVGSTLGDMLTGAAGVNVLNGNGGNDIINGNGGSDTIDGGSGNDTLYGGSGDDMLAGGAGNDRFMFANGFGHDTIADFSANDAEKIDLSAVSGITDFADLVNNHLNTDGGTGFALIDDGAGVDFLLNGVTVAQIGNGLAYSGADFIF